MQAGGVAVDLAVAVAELAEVVHIFVEGRLRVLGGQGQGQAHFHEEDAVGFAGVDRQPFGFDFQRAGHIRGAEEMLGHLDDQFAEGQVAVAGHEVHHFVEILHVFLREARIALFIGGSVENEPEKGAEEYENAFHILKKGKPVSRILYPCGLLSFI